MRSLRDVNTRAVRTELDHEDAEGLALVWREDGNAGKIVVVVGDLLFGEVSNGVILLRLAVRGDVEEDWETRRYDTFGKGRPVLTIVQVEEDGLDVDEQLAKESKVLAIYLRGYE